jgi:hypothetical protein
MTQRASGSSRLSVIARDFEFDGDVLARAVKNTYTPPN